MKRGQKFRFLGRRYQFLEWERDRVARVISIETQQEMWIEELPPTLKEIRRLEDLADAAKRRVRQTRSQLSAADRERIRKEADQLIMAVPALRQLAIDCGKLNIDAKQEE
jgi:hypothetical protein